MIKDIKPFDGSSTKAMELLKQSATPEERRVLQEIWDRAEAQCRVRAEDQGWLGNPYAAGDAALEALEEVEARIERATPPTVRPEDQSADRQLAAVLVDHFWRSSFVAGAAKIERGEATKEEAIRDFLANSGGRTHERVETLAETMGTNAAYNYIMRNARDNDPRLAADIRTRAWGPPIIGG